MSWLWPRPSIKTAKRRIEEKQDIAFCLLDIDNFKACNDRYGYAKGKELIRITADIIKQALAEFGGPEDFLGHIGGDDFVIITDPDRYRPICESIIIHFDHRIPSLYDVQDSDRGYITSENRQGEEVEFKLATISIAVVTNEQQTISSYIRYGEIAAETKRLQEALDNAVNPADKAATHLALAWLYIAYNDPRRDYDKALVNRVQYERLDPEGAADRRVRNWVTVLDTVKSIAKSSGQQQTAMQATIDRQQIQPDQLRQQVRQNAAKSGQADKRVNDLRQRQRDLQKKIAALETENQNLRETIEKLKTLDLFLEQKER